MVKKLPAGPGQTHAARQPQQELRPWLILDAAHVAAKRRLGDAQMVSRPGDAAQLGDLNDMIFVR